VYRIQVSREDRITSVEQSWKVVADTGNERDGGHIYDYVPVEVQKTVTVELLDLRVDELNLPFVIQAALGGVKA